MKGICASPFATLKDIVEGCCAAAVKLKNSRTFQISGLVTAGAKSFNGTSGVNLEVTNVAQADKLSTARTINGVEFDGTKNIVIVAVPTGVVLPWAGNNAAPSGYLLCDGRAVSRTTYADLFAVIGVSYGNGDGSTTFNLPGVMDNRFIEGAETAGIVKSAGLPNITGIGMSVHEEIWSPTYSTEFHDGAIIKGNSHGEARLSGTNDDDSTYKKEFYGWDFDASLSNPIYSESCETVQPKSLTMRYIIKF